MDNLTIEKSHVHQVSRGMYTLCALEILAGIHGTRKTEDVTCPECIRIREQVKAEFALFKLHPEPGDVIIVRCGPRPLMEEVVKEALDLTEAMRANYPEVTFCLLPDEETLEIVSKEEMAALGWHRGERIPVRTKSFGFKRGKLTKK